MFVSECVSVWGKRACARTIEIERGNERGKERYVMKYGCLYSTNWAVTLKTVV